MARKRDSEAISALWELLATWRRESAESADVSLRVAAQQLERLLSDPEMESVWSSLAQNSKRAFNDVAAKLLLNELFERAAPLPPWQSQTGKLRRQQLDQIAQTAARLRQLLHESPIRHLSPEALETMQLNPRLADGNHEIRLAPSSDFDEALEDLKEQAQFWRNVNPLIRYPAREDAHRRYFVISVAGYLERNFRPGLHREVAIMARIMLRDDDIDTEVVRKILGPAGIRPGRKSKS